MKKVLGTLLQRLCLLYLVTGSLYAQVDVHVNLDSASIMIGDHLGINVDISAAVGTEIQNIQFGNWADEGRIEILDIKDLNTIAESPQLLLQQRLFLTTFDSGYHKLPPLEVIYKLNGILDTAYSGDLGLNVVTLAVQEEAPIRDNKDILRENLNLRDGLPYFIGLTTLTIIGFLINRRRKKAISAEDIVIPVVIRPAHEIALEKLLSLKAAAHWLQGATKDFQSELTYILREYLENRYDIHALEATTYEINNSIASLDIDQTHKEQLKSILETADLVKFAKAEPPIDIHPQALAAVIVFVEDTHEVPTSVSQEESDTNESQV